MSSSSVGGANTATWSGESNEKVTALLVASVPNNEVESDDTDAEEEEMGEAKLVDEGESLGEI